MTDRDSDLHSNAARAAAPTRLNSFMVHGSASSQEGLELWLGPSRKSKHPIQGLPERKMGINNIAGLPDPSLAAPDSVPGLRTTTYELRKGTPEAQMECHR